MKAVFIDRHGGLEALKYGELPDPVPNPGEILADERLLSFGTSAIFGSANWNSKL